MQELTLTNPNDIYELLKKAAFRYYNCKDPILTDAEYDAYFNKLKQMVNSKKIQDDKVIDFVNNQVGCKVGSSVKTLPHISKMYSLDNVYNEEQMRKWLNRYPNETFLIAPKFDGVSLNLIYQDGKLISAITRGDGLLGLNVTDRVKYIKHIPETIKTQGIVEVRGEVVINLQQFELLNQHNEEHARQLFANPRNTAAGSMTIKDLNEVSGRGLEFLLWGVGSYPTQETSYFKVLWDLKQAGFNLYLFSTANGAKQSIDDIMTMYTELAKKQFYPCDGLVVSIDNISKRKGLGHTQKCPRYAVAFKFPPAVAKVKITGVELSLAKSGKITPKAVFDQVELDGSKISRCSLFNFDYIARNDIRIGDTAIVIKQGGVIPVIERIVKEERQPTSQPIQPPTTCPSCNAQLTKDFCKNTSCKR